MTSKLIEDIYKICEDKINKIKEKKYKCMINQLHECNSFCISCNDFICNDCFKNHEKNHKLILLDSKLNDLKQKLDAYKDISSIYEKKNNNKNKPLIEINTKIIKNGISRIDELIKKFKEIQKTLMRIFDLRISLVKSHNIEKQENQKNIEKEKNKIIFEDIKIEILQKINNYINKTNETKEIVKYFVEFYNLLEYTVKINEIKIPFTDYEKNNKNTNELNKILIDQVDILYNQNNELFPLIEKKIKETEYIFTKIVCNSLKISMNEYNSQKKIKSLKIDIDYMKKEKDDEKDINFKSQIFNTKDFDDLKKDNKKNIQIIEKIVEKPVEKIIEKVIEKPIEKIVEKIVEKPVEKIIEKIIEKPIEKIVEKIVEKPVEKIIEKPVEKIIEKPIVKIVEKIIENPMEKTKEKIITKYKFLNSQLVISNIFSFEIEKSYSNNNESQLNEEIKEDKNDKNIYNEDGNNENEEDDKINIDNIIKNNNEKNDNVEKKNPQNSLYNREEDKSSIFLDSFEVFTNENCNQLINDDMEEGFFDKIKTIKDLEHEERAIIICENNKKLEKEAEIEIYNKTCQKKIKELKKKINILSSRKDIIKKEIKIFSQNERNLLELMSPRGESINIFNPYLNEVEEILIPENYRIAKNCSYLNILPYCYVSGGIKLDEKKENIESTEFFAIRRRGPKKFEFIYLPMMIESKSNHCMIELKYLNGIGVIGGTDSKDCEVFNIRKNEWYNLPDLNNLRENPCCCVLNEKILFCFFGYDNKAYKYHTTIEKIDLKSKEKWDEINPEGQQIYMKRKSASCLYYNLKGKDHILIVGGVNSLQNESIDCLIYNEKENKIERKNNVLPFKCSFKQNSFNILCSDYYCNFTTDSLIIQYEKMGGIFFGIREN